MPNGCARASYTKGSLTIGEISPRQHSIWMFSCFISTPYHRQKLVRRTAQKQVTTFPKCPPPEVCTTSGHYVGGTVQNRPTRSGRATENHPTTWGELHRLCCVDGQSIMNTIQKSAHLTSRARKTPILRLTAMLPSQHLRRTTQNQKGR